MMALTIPFQYAENLPLIPEDGVVAYIIDVNSGQIHDVAYGWETAINYIQNLAWVAVAVADETHWCSVPADCSYCQTYGNVTKTKAELQAMFNHERALQEDCFGLQHVEAVAA